ncbi:MAG: hypothetical protein IT282_16245 [Bacteroidetes bacterium]|nr:hypothetical protein [Bacteroidota bacterium]
MNRQSHTGRARDAQGGRPAEHTPGSGDAQPLPQKLRVQPARHTPTIPPRLYSLGPGDSRYPPALERWRDWCEEDGLFSDATPLACLGDLALLQRPTLGLLCSAHCPGSVLLDTFRFVRTATPESPTFIGGFHSPMERTCLDTLLVRHVPVIFCPGRRLSARSAPAAWKPAIAERRLLLLSPFSERQKRVDRALARLRNAFVIALADSLFVPYARPGGSVLALVAVALRKGKRVMTLDDPENAPLVRMGARRLEVGELIQRFCLSPAAGSA